MGELPEIHLSRARIWGEFVTTKSGDKIRVLILPEDPGLVRVVLLEGEDVGGPILSEAVIDCYWDGVETNFSVA